MRGALSWGAQAEAGRENSQHLATATGAHLRRAPRPTPGSSPKTHAFFFSVATGPSRGLALEPDVYCTNKGSESSAWPCICQSGATLTKQTGSDLEFPCPN